MISLLPESPTGFYQSGSPYLPYPLFHEDAPFFNQTKIDALAPNNACFDMSDCVSSGSEMRGLKGGTDHV